MIILCSCSVSQWEVHVCPLYKIVNTPFWSLIIPDLWFRNVKPFYRSLYVNVCTMPLLKSIIHHSIPVLHDHPIRIPFACQVVCINANDNDKLWRTQCPLRTLVLHQALHFSRFVADGSATWFRYHKNTPRPPRTNINQLYLEDRYSQQMHHMYRIFLLWQRSMPKVHWFPEINMYSCP